MRKNIAYLFQRLMSFRLFEKSFHTNFETYNLSHINTEIFKVGVIPGRAVFYYRNFQISLS